MNLCKVNKKYIYKENTARNAKKTDRNTSIWENFSMPELSLFKHQI